MKFVHTADTHLGYETTKTVRLHQAEGHLTFTRKITCPGMSQGNRRTAELVSEAIERAIFF